MSGIMVNYNVIQENSPMKLHKVNTPKKNICKEE